MAEAATAENQVVPEGQQTEQTQQEQTQENKKNDPPEWVLRRFGELTAARKAAEERAAQAQAALEAAQRQPQEGQTQEGAQHPNVMQLAQTMAEQMVQQQVRQSTITQKVQSIEKEGREQFGEEFDRAIQHMQIAGIGSQEFLEAITSIPNAAKTVRYLGDPNNIEEAIRISQLPPVQMAIEMANISAKASKATAKEISAAPAPITPVDSNQGKAVGAEPDPKDTEKWMEWRRQNARRK